MRVEFSDMCRGFGVIYVRSSFLLSPYQAPIFEALSETNLSLPIEAYLLDSDGSRVQYALTTPMLDTQSVIFKVSIKELDGKISSVFTKRFSRNAIKWISRLNYKLHNKSAHEVRDIDRFTYSDQIHLRIICMSHSTDDSSLIVKGIACSPTNCKDLSFTVLDGMGKDTGISLYVSQSKPVTFEESPRLETPFTVRIPNDGATYCLVASGAEGVRSGFLCFDEASRGRYEADHAVRYYLLASNGIWEASSHFRSRRFSVVNKDDYKVQNGPLFSIVVPLYNTPSQFFREMVESVVNQLYPNWELILVNSTPQNQELAKELAALSDSRIKIIKLDRNLGISGNTNAGIKEAQGDYIAFFDHDDLLDKMALFLYAKRIVDDPSIDALYCDEDFLTEDDHVMSPHFKSDFNIDLLRCHNYITHFLVVKAHLAKDLLLNSEYDGAQDYDFLLRLSECTRKICHIPEVLYHWRMSDTSTAKNSDNKSYADDAGLLALNDHLKRCGLSAHAETTSHRCYYKTVYEPRSNALVSIIIPNKDSVEVLSRCLESLYAKTSYKNFEVIVVENNSVSKETFEYYEKITSQYPRCRVLTWEYEFNYSKINNFAVNEAAGEYILLLNNDIEIIHSGWLTSMLGICERDDVGAVGAKLLYPDNTIQHAGIAMMFCSSSGIQGGPIHAFNHLDAETKGYMNRPLLTQDVQIVTGACLLVKRSVFDLVGGFSEAYAVAYNDVDFCLKIRREGLLVVYDADAVLYHYESFSRGSDEVPERKQRFISEQGRLRMDWPKCFAQPDPYFGKYIF